MASTAHLKPAKAQKAHTVQRFSIFGSQPASVMRWGFAELLEQFGTIPMQAENAASFKYQISGWDAEWVGEHYDRLRKMTSWPEGLKLARSYTADLGESTPILDSIRRKRVWAEDGDEFSRDRFDSGFPECWAARKRRSKRSPKGGIIKLTCGVGGNCSVLAKDLAWSGAAAVMLVDTLEEAGYRVEVEGIVSTSTLGREDGKGDFAAIDIIQAKHADEPLDCDRMLFILSNPGFFRGHLFRALWERPFRCHGGLGHQVSVPKELYGDLHIEQVRSHQTAQEAIANAIKAMGALGYADDGK